MDDASLVGGDAGGVGESGPDELDGGDLEVATDGTGGTAAEGRDLVADLHVHTTVSDGTMALADVPAAARRAGLDWVAVTDHDRVHPGLAAPIERRDGVALVRGIELRVEPAGTDERVDLLGYAVEPTPALRRELERLQRDRVERARRIVDCIETRLGVDLDVDIREGIGRPHVARAVDACDGTDLGYDDAFAELIGDDGPCYVARDVTPFDRGVELLRASCALVGLAHPHRYDDPEAALALTAELDAVERCYPYGRPVDPAPVEAAIERHGLLATGGSDAHEDELGTAGLDADGFEPVRDRLQPS
jgi:hypothetical protein